MQNISAVQTQENPRTLTILAPKTNIPIDIVFEYVSPAMAKQWLKDNVDNNRKPNTRFVKSYSKAMANDLWDAANGESIKFNQDGKMVDGQHRLLGIIDYGKPVWMLVMYGVSKDAILTVDDGNTRSLNDAFTIDGVKLKGRRSSHSAAVRTLYQLRDSFIEDTSFHTTRTRRTTNRELINFYENLTGYDHLSEELHDKWSIGELEKVIPCSVLIPMYYLFSDIYPKAVDRVMQVFFDKFPADGNKQDPAFLVMRKIQKMREDQQIIRVYDFINLFIFAMLKIDSDENVKLVPPLNWQFRNDFKGRLQAKQKLQRVG